MSDFLIFVAQVLLVFVGLVFLVSIPWLVWKLRRYIIVWLATHDIFWTKVPEGKFKIILEARDGGYYKTLLCKKGHKLDADNRIVQLDPGDEELPTIQWIGWPGIRTPYAKTMVFSKSTEQAVVPHNDPNIYAFLADVDYPYALLFDECEDVNNVPLKGYMTLIASIVGPYESNFGTTNFYETMIGLVKPVVRDAIRTNFTFDDLKAHKDNLDNIVWAALTLHGPNGEPSIVEDLNNLYGVCLKKVKTVNVDPQDEELRKLTLTQYTAERRLAAATAVSKAKGKEVVGPLQESMDLWVADQLGPKPDPANATATARYATKVKALKASEAYKKASQDAKDLLLADGGNLGVSRLEMSGPDGKSLPDGLTYLSFGGGGGGVGVFAGGGNPSKGGKNPGGGNPGGKSDKQVAEETHNQTGRWPSWWDPQTQQRK
jgi:hypothetical protein